MPKAGVIAVNLNAGASKFIVDMDAAAAKVTQFKERAVSDSKAAAAGMKVLEGQLLDNKKAAESFFERMGGGSAIMKKAFPILGAVAFVNLLVDAGEKVYQFYQNIRDGEAKAAAAFRSLNAPLRETNLELAIANERLALDIARLEKKPRNTLALALAEAKAAANDLADSLDRDLQSLHKLLEEQGGGWLRHLFGKADLPEEIGGKTGFGGVIGRVAEITAAGRVEVSAAADETSLKEAQKKLDANLAKYYNEELARIEGLLKKAEPSRFDPGPNAGPRSTRYDFNPGDPKAAEMLKGIRAKLQDELAAVQERSRAGTLRERHDELKTKETTRVADPFGDRMAALGAQLEGLQAKFESIGQSESGQVMAKAYGEAAKAIAEINKALETNLDIGDQVRMRAIQNTIAMTEADIDWRTQFTASTTEIEARIRAEKSLAAAIGQGFAATRAASIEARVMQELGPKGFDKQWMGSHAAEVDVTRALVTDEFDAKDGAQAKQAIETINKQIALEEHLATVQVEGAEAVRRAMLENRIQKMRDANASQEQIAAEIRLYEVQQTNSSAASIADLNQRTKALRSMTAALIDGAAAERRAGLEAMYSDMARNGQVADIDAQRQADATEHQHEITRSAIESGNVYRDQLETIGEQVLALQRLKEVKGSTFEIELALRDLENRKLDVLVQQSLQLGSARDGVRAFFLDMQKSAQSASQTIYQTLHDTFSRGTEQLARLATGQKTDVGGMLRDVGGNLVQTQIRGAAQKGLSLIASKFHVDTGPLASLVAGKPDGTAESRAFWVRMAGVAGIIPGIPVPAGGKNLGDVIGGWFGSGSKGRGIFSFLGNMAKGFGGARADGGRVDPGRAYFVGERGPELFVPSSAGSVVANHNIGGSTIHNHYHVDARGSDLGASHRIARALEMTHNAAVSSSVRAQQERMARTPR
ncbi:MAG: hypothetical protein ABI811_22970 [Acidobacteriota bacterium]